MAKVQFYSAEIENDAIGCMIYDQKSALKALVELSEEDFYDDKNRTVYRAMQNVFAKDQAIDLVTVSAELDAMGIGRENVLHIAKTSQMSSVAITGLIEKLVAMRKRRILYKYAVDVQQTAKQETDIEKVVNTARDLPSLEGEKNQVYTVVDLLSDATQRMIERKSSGNKIHGIPTGFKDIDVMTGGLTKKEMTVLGARPSVGKSVLGLDISRNAARKGFQTIYFSLEMGKEQLTDRMICAELMIKSDHVKYPQLMSTEDLKKMQNATMDKDLESLHVDDQSDIDLAGIRVKCKQHILKYGKVDLIVIDYLQYMQGKGNNKREITENNSKGLKQLAKDLDTHVIVISSLNRANEGRSDKRPTMADLRESGQIEFDADNIILMHRDRMSEEKEARQVTELIFEKQRCGRTGTIKVIFLEEFTTFKDLVR